MKKTMISLMTAICLLSVISCKKNDDSISKSDPVAVSLPKGLINSTFSSGITVSVPLGGNIQHAIDSVAAAGGGTVNLASGTWTLTSTILLKSNVTLNGAGNPNTTLKTNTVINIISTYAEGLSNLTVQNLKIIGVTDTLCNGIWIAALSNHFRHVTISNVQVTGCGGMGVHLKRVDTATVSNCNLHNNGNSVYCHNIYVRQSTYITISGNTLSSSPVGTGLHVAGSPSTNLTITGNTVTGNGIAGMNIQDSPDVILIQHNTVSSNGVNHGTGHGDGISFTGTNATIDSNTCNSNFEGGIHTWSGSGSVTNNHASGNATNYNIHGTFTQSNNL